MELFSDLKEYIPTQADDDDDDDDDDEVRACIEKAYVVVTYRMSIRRSFEFPPINTQQIRTPRNLDMKRCHVP